MLLSIIVPIYNNSEYIVECLDSICRQSFSDYEVIVVDDGSTDDSRDLIRDYIRVHPGSDIRLIEHDNNKGLPAARKTGADAARAKYIGFVDSDDLIAEDHYELLVGIMEEHHCDMACSGVQMIGKKSRADLLKRSSAQEPCRELSAEEARVEIFDRRDVRQYAWNKVYRSDIIKKITFPQGNPIGEDFHFLMSYLDLADKVCVSDAATYYYRQHEGMMTRKTDIERRLYSLQLYEAYYDSFDGDSEEKSALARFLMLEYMSVLINMYRSRSRDKKAEKMILTFIDDHRKDYLKNSEDGFFAKTFSMIARKNTSEIMYRIWSKR